MSMTTLHVPGNWRQRGRKSEPANVAAAKAEIRALAAEANESTAAATPEVLPRVEAPPPPIPITREIRQARDRLLAAAERQPGEAPIRLVPEARKPKCPLCRGLGYTWLTDPRTLQREVGDCPACPAKRPALPENSHRTGGKPMRRGFQHYLRA